MSDSESDDEYVPQTQALRTYCLTKTDLAGLDVVLKRNPFGRNDIRLLKVEDVVAKAHAKHGGEDGLRRKRAKNAAVAAKAAATRCVCVSNKTNVVF